MPSDFLSKDASFVYEINRQSQHLLMFHLILFQILNLAANKSEIERKVHQVIDNFAERGLRSLAVAYQVIECC